MPRTYLGWSIASAVLCFLPTGLVATWFGWRVTQCVDAQDADGAARASMLARRWLIVTIALGLAAWILIAVVLGLLGATLPWAAN
jgi:hypothetical protein